MYNRLFLANCQGQKEWDQEGGSSWSPWAGLQHKRYKAVKICFLLSLAVTLFITIVNFSGNINLYLPLF